MISFGNLVHDDIPAYGRLPKWGIEDIFPFFSIDIPNIGSRSELARVGSERSDFRREIKNEPLLMLFDSGQVAYRAKVFMGLRL
jgi:hypothetical protein